MVRTPLAVEWALGALVSVLSGTAWAATNAVELATTPAHRLTDPRWKERHEQQLQRARQGGYDLVFLGDSITQGWEGAGKEVWAQFYGARKALNLGIGGDRTEHVLWRLDEGIVDGLKPKALVLMLGTNNTGHRNDPPEAIAAGMEAILKKLRQRLPETKILLLAIFPRSAQATDPMRVNNDRTNERLAKFADGKTVFFLSVNDKLLGADGALSKEIMPDLLHPQKKGYQIWAEAMEPELTRLLGP